MRHQKYKFSKQFYYNMVRHIHFFRSFLLFYFWYLTFFYFSLSLFLPRSSSSSSFRILILILHVFFFLSLNFISVFYFYPMFHVLDFISRKAHVTVAIHPRSHYVIITNVTDHVRPFHDCHRPLPGPTEPHAERRTSLRSL